MKNIKYTLIIIAVALFSQAKATVHKITLSGMSFSPSSITIHVGDTIEWINKGGNHNVDGSKSIFPKNPQSFKNGKSSPKHWTFSFRFDTTGTYNYRCDIHHANGMVGTIAVLPKRGNGHIPTKEVLIKDVKKYILKDEKKHDGYILVYDSLTKKTLKLKLDSIHKDKFALMDKCAYFICSDFTDSAGKTNYDIDTFLDWDGKKFKATNRKVHKVNGKPRYVWYKDGAIWKTKKPPKNGGKEGKDHPGH